MGHRLATTVLNCKWLRCTISTRVLHSRGLTRGARGLNSQGAKSLWGRRKVPRMSEVLSSTAHLLPKGPRFEKGRQTCFLPRAPSNLLTPLPALQLLVNFKRFSYLTHMRNIRGILLLDSIL